MSSLEAMDHRLTFDDILEAVQESKRGRWFLKEFEQRLQKQDSSTILQAIAKLESRMEGFGAQAGQPEELTKVKAAIANARNDLLKLGVGKEALSTEGQMFAQLAEMARKAMPATTENSASVVRTLQLVAEIENTISPGRPVDRGAKYFGADENLFERTSSATKPVLVAQSPVAAVVDTPIAQIEKPAPVRAEEPPATGAKLIIRRTSVNEDPVVEQATAEPREAPEPVAPVAEVAAVLPVPVTSEEIAAINSPRIVIVRRKAEDMPEVAEEEISAA
jgi:hypothetical protein